MKKKLLFSTLTLSTALLLFPASANASSAEELLEKYTAATQNLPEFSMTSDLNLAVGLGMDLDGATVNMDVAFLGDLVLDFIKDPLSMKADGSFQLSVPGESDESIDFQLYLVPGEEDSLDYYVYIKNGEASTWEYSSAPADTLSSITEALNGSSSAVSELPGTLTLEEESVDVNGISCQQLNWTLTYSDLETLILDALETSGLDEDAEELESTLSLLSMALDGIQLNSRLFLEEATSLPAKIRIDFAGSDLSMLNQLLAYSLASTDDEDNTVFPEITLNIDNLYMEFTYDYNDVPEITVPEEALKEKEENPDASLEDLTSDLMGDIA